METTINEVVLPITPSPTEASQSPKNYFESKTHSSTILEEEPMPKFELAPTPAQLGLRRSKNKMKQNNVLNAIDTSVTTEKSQVGSNVQKNNVEISNTSVEFNFKERFRTLPQFDYDNYTSPTQWPPCNQWMQSMDNLNEPQTKRYATEVNSVTYSSQNNSDLSQRNLIGNHFFGPDFNVAQFNGKTDDKKNC